MRWTVTTPPEAENELTNIWLNASDRRAVTRASATIDRGLARDPLSQGTDEGDHRSWTVAPLTVTYKVSPDDCLVQILHYTSP
jgi:hypothetical protein